MERSPRLNFEKYRKVKVLVDSGAAENVVPPDFFPDYNIEEGEPKRKQIKYTTADGNELCNLGEINLPFLTREGYKCGVKFQVCDDQRPLLSVSALTARGNDVDFGKTGGRITSQDGKQQIHFTREDGFYILEMYVPPFTRQGR